MVQYTVKNSGIKLILSLIGSWYQLGLGRKLHLFFVLGGMNWQGTCSSLEDQNVSSFFHQPREPSASTVNSDSSEHNHRNVGCENDAYEGSDEVEISEF